MQTSPNRWVLTGMPMNRVLEKPAMATNTPIRSRGSRSRAATPKDSSRVAATPRIPDTTWIPARNRSSWSRLFSSPTTQLQGTAMLTMYLLRNFFSFAVIQPMRPIK